MFLGLVAQATYWDDLPTDTVSGDETCGVPISLNFNSTGHCVQSSSSSHYDFFEGCFLTSNDSPSSELNLLYAAQEDH